MASILQRFTAIIKANINEALDNAEDPAKMVDQYLRDLKSDLAEVKNETASVMAEETRAKAALDKNNKEIEEMMKYAEAALAKGNEADARTFLEKKAELTNNGVSLQETYNIAAANATKMREMHNKLVDDIKALEARKDMIKGKVAVAKTQERMNNIQDSVSSARGGIEAFERMEAKADRMLNMANAKAELNAPAEGSVEDIKAKYDVASSDVDAELEALKAKLAGK